MYSIVGLKAQFYPASAFAFFYTFQFRRCLHPLLVVMGDANAQCKRALKKNRITLLYNEVASSGFVTQGRNTSDRTCSKDEITFSLGTMGDNVEY